MLKAIKNTNFGYLHTEPFGFVKSLYCLLFSQDSGLKYIPTYHSLLSRSYSWKRNSFKFENI